MHERERAPALDLQEEAPAQEDELAPGRRTRSARLNAPENPMVSGLIQRKADAGQVADNASEALAATSTSAGKPLPDRIQRKFESSLGTDLSSVRVHTGSESADAARSVSAKAYTTGQDIHFGAGHYDPDSDSGQRLLAHEVAHTVQQSGGVSRKPMFKLEVSQPEDEHEQDADKKASQMVDGGKDKSGDKKKEGDPAAAESGGVLKEDKGEGEPAEGAEHKADDTQEASPEQAADAAQAAAEATAGGGGDAAAGAETPEGNTGDVTHSDSAPAPEVSAPGDSAESAADAAVPAMMTGAPVDVAPASEGDAGVMRAPDAAAAANAAADKAAQELKGSWKMKKTLAEAPMFKIFKGKGEIGFSVEWQAKGASPTAKLSKDAVENEIKKKVYDSGTSTIEATGNADVSWKDKKISIGGGAKCKTTTDYVDLETSGKVFLFNINSKGEITAPSIKITGKVASKPLTIPIPNATMEAKIAYDVTVTLELDPKQLTGELLKKIAEAAARQMGPALAAAIPVAMILNGVLVIGTIINAMTAAKDLGEMVNKWPEVMAKARETFTKAAAEVKAGGGPLFESLAKNMAGELGELPKELLVNAFGDKATPDALGKVMWPKMRQQAIDKAVAEYRGKHQAESVAYDITHAFDSKEEAEKNHHKGTWGENILVNNLQQALPASWGG